MRLTMLARAMSSTQGIGGALGPAMASEGQEQEARVALTCAFLGLLISLGMFFALPNRPRKEGSGASEDSSGGRAEMEITGEEPRSTLWIWAITSLNVPYGFAVAGLGLMITPLEAERLWPQNHSMALGLLAALAGLAQLVGPLAGHWSDTYQSSLGRRRPLLMISASVTCSLTFALWYLSVQRLRDAFTMVFFFQQLSLNILFSVQSGLVPDLVPESQIGLAGGASAANVLIGAVAACAYVHLAKTADYHMLYAAMVIFFMLFSLFVCATAREKSSLQCALLDNSTNVSDNNDSSGRNSQFWFMRIAERYTFDFWKHRNFAVLLLTKTLYCASVVVKAFLLFFVQDLFKSLETSRYEEMVGEMAACAEISAALAALGLMIYLSKIAGDPGELLPESESLGSSRRSLLCLRCGAGWMAGLWFVPVILGGLANRQRHSVGAEQLVDTWLPPMLIGLAIWGLGHGVYLAGDQALAFALIPDRAEASRFLGFSSVCVSIGSVIGGSAAAGLLSFFGEGASTGYAFPGYAAIFIFASLLSAAIATLAATIDLRSSSSAIPGKVSEA